MRLSRLALPLLLAVASPAAADDTADFLKTDNWEGLAEYWKFDGKSLVGDTGKDGINFNTFYCSKQKYADFELTFKVKMVGATANSGVQIRSKIEEKEKDKFVVAGPQCDMGQQYWGSLYGERFGGMMKAASPDLVKKVVKEKEFNDYSIRSVGKKVTIKVNGETTVDEEFALMPADGIIAFQVHGGKGMVVTFTDFKFAKIAAK